MKKKSQAILFYIRLVMLAINIISYFLIRKINFDNIHNKPPSIFQAKVN